MTEQADILYTDGRYKIGSGETWKMNTREQRGLAIAALCRIVKDEAGGYRVPSQRGDGTIYEVSLAGPMSKCTCRDYQDRAVKCKHMFAVEFVISRETHPDGSVTVEKTITVTERVTYPQNWPAYNAAQVNEKERFQVLLRDLCRSLPEPVSKGGRMPLRPADAVFAAVFKALLDGIGPAVQLRLEGRPRQGVRLDGPSL